MKTRPLPLLFAQLTTLLIIMVAGSLVLVKGQKQIQLPKSSPNQVIKKTSSIKKSNIKLSVCFKWWTQVDPTQVRVEISPSSLTNEEIIEGIGCLLQLKGNKNTSRFTGTTRGSIYRSQGYRPPKHPATVEIGALYYISYLFYEDWEHASSVALYDEVEEDFENINSPEIAERAFQSYENWFAIVQMLGLKRAREQKLDPLASSGISWTNSSAK